MTNENLTSAIDYLERFPNAVDEVDLWGAIKTAVCNKANLAISKIMTAAKETAQTKKHLKGADTCEIRRAAIREKTKPLFAEMEATGNELDLLIKKMTSDGKRLRLFVDKINKKAEVVINENDREGAPAFIAEIKLDLEKVYVLIEKTEVDSTKADWLIEKHTELINAVRIYVEMSDAEKEAHKKVSELLRAEIEAKEFGVEPGSTLGNDSFCSGEDVPTTVEEANRFFDAMEDIYKDVTVKCSEP